MIAMTLAMALAAGMPPPAERSGAQGCEPCHARHTPGIVAAWKASGHAAKVGCAVCHGEDGKAIHSGPARKRVEAAACAKCHAARAAEHAAGKHGAGLRAGRGCTRNEPETDARNAGCVLCHEEGSTRIDEPAHCARFLRQSAAMQRQGCDACHAVERRCDTCHGAHHTDRKLAGDAGTCATCHMGPDHAQYEMWKTSRHGVVFAERGAAEAPDCRQCHMPAGTHDVSAGITMGLAGQPYPAEKRERERARMLDVCGKCHTRDFAKQNLADADAVQKESKALVAEGAALVTDLDRLGLLDPSPATRRPHPLAGAKLELGPQMLYEDLSGAEAIFFRMKKFAYVSAWKGVFHQNPDYAHWYGNAQLKLGLSELRSESALLRRVRLLEERLTVGGAAPAPAPDALRRELSELKQRRVRGELDDAGLQKAQRELLEKAGL